MKYEPIENVDAFRRLVHFGDTTESLVLEFKRELDGLRAKEPERAKKHRELARDISQFANTDGGCILIGVEEESRDGKGIAKRIVPVTDAHAVIQWIEQAIATYLVPSTLSHSIVPLDVDGATVLALNIPPSVHLVSVYDRGLETIQAFRRTNHGKQHLNPDEYEAHLMNGSRAAKLAFDRVNMLRKPSDSEVYLATPISVESFSPGHGLQRHLRTAKCWLHGVKDTEFELTVDIGGGGRIVTVPYGLLREVWIRADGRMALMLASTLIWNGDDLLFTS